MVQGSDFLHDLTWRCRVMIVSSMTFKPKNPPVEMPCYSGVLNTDTFIL